MSEMNGSQVLKRNGDALPKSGKATQNGTAEYLWLSSSSGSRGALPKPGKSTDSSVPDLLNPSAGYNIERVIAELEKRRAEIFALARAAEARVQAAEEKREQAEHRLKQETNQRLVAEQRLRELEEHRLRQLQAVKAAENYARSLALALAEANRKRAKAEAIARAAEEKAHRIKAFSLGAEAAAHEATERHLLFGFLIFANRRAEAVPRQATERHKAAEARLQYEVNQRALAGRRFKAFDRRFPRVETLQHSWKEFGEFVRKIAKSVDKMLINFFR